MTELDDNRYPYQGHSKGFNKVGYNASHDFTTSKNQTSNVNEMQNQETRTYDALLGEF